MRVFSRVLAAYTAYPLPWGEADMASADGQARDFTGTRPDYPSKASAEARAARESKVSSGSGNGLPLSRKRLVMG